RLSIFRGGFTLAAAEAVGPGAEETLEVLEGLAQLRDGSLLVALESGSEKLPEMRYRMLETVREFAREQLEAGEQALLQERHRAYFLHRVEEAEGHFWRSEQEEWFLAL